MSPNRRSQLAASRGLDKADLEQRTYHGEVRPVVSATQRYYDATKKAWREFLSFMSLTEAKIEASVQDGAPLAAVEMVKRFLEWYVGGSKGQLGEYMTLSSTENCWHRLATCFTRWTGKEFPEVVDGDILGYIRGSLMATYDLKDRMKEKGYADEVDIDHLVTQLFYHDFDGFYHDRHTCQQASRLAQLARLGRFDRFY